jgi:hypothetical protein
MHNFLLKAKMLTSNFRLGLYYCRVELLLPMVRRNKGLKHNSTIAV